MALFDDIIAVTGVPKEIEKVKKVEVTESTKVTVIDNQTKEEKVIKDETKPWLRSTVTKSPSWLTVKFSSNVNVGNYQSVKVEKGLMIPVGVELDPEVEKKIQRTDDWACKLIERLIDKEIQPILEAVKKNNEQAI